MEAFYELARIDYRHLATAYDWADTFRALGERSGRVRLADVACGSGKFPEALLAHTPLTGLTDLRVTCDLLDPSPFSIREARGVLSLPFQPGAEFCCTLQDWEPEAGSYDVTWATHALYCVPAEELEAGLDRLCRALAPGGFGFVAQGLRDGHYVGFYDRWCEAFAKGLATPYSDGAQVEAALRRLGMHVRTRELTYTTVVAADRRELLERYLQRCAFDEEVGLDEMLEREPVAAYLAACHDEASREYRFPQRVATMLFARSDSVALPGDGPAPRRSDA
jgi:hypothetical protein